MRPTKKYTGTVQVVDGKIKAIDLKLPGETLSDMQQIMALKHVLENYVKEYEREPARRV